MDGGCLRTWIVGPLLGPFGNISNFKIVNRSTDFFEILVDIEVTDLKHLNNIIANLRAKEVVQSVERYQT